MNPESSPDGLSKPLFLVGLALGVLRFPEDKSFALEEAPDYDYPGGVTFSVTKKWWAPWCFLSMGQQMGLATGFLKDCRGTQTFFFLWRVPQAMHFHKKYANFGERTGIFFPMLEDIKYRW